MVEKYENITFKIEDELFDSLDINLRKNIKLFKRSYPRQNVILIRPFLPIDFIQFIYDWLKEKNLPEINCSEITITTNWLNEKFSHFAVYPDIINDEPNIIIGYKFEYSERSNHD